MHITAHLKNSFQVNEIKVSTENNSNEISVASKQDGYGSSVNGGELLFSALAVCCCNDLYREAARRSMKLEMIDVIVEGRFGREGEPASDISYTVKVTASPHSTDEINDLISYVDGIAEVHNTLRKGVNVSLKK